MLFPGLRTIDDGEMEYRSEAPGRKVPSTVAPKLLVTLMVCTYVCSTHKTLAHRSHTRECETREARLSDAKGTRSSSYDYHAQEVHSITQMNLEGLLCGHPGEKPRYESL